MPTSKQLHILATRPTAYREYVANGNLPAGVVPKSPLIALLSVLAPQDLGLIRGRP